MTAWTVYTRPGCSLCEHLLEEFAAVLGEAAAARVNVIDISDNPELEAKYARRIPVVLADGEFVCAYKLDVERVKGYLQN
jgi:predicted thioredoxin/glutaredoxin